MLRNTNQQISPMAVVIWVIALQYCVPCMPCLVCSKLAQKKKKLGSYPKSSGFSHWHTSTQTTIAALYPSPSLYYPHTSEWFQLLRTPNLPTPYYSDSPLSRWSLVSISPHQTANIRPKSAKYKLTSHVLRMTVTSCAPQVNWKVVNGTNQKHLRKRQKKKNTC